MTSESIPQARLLHSAPLAHDNLPEVHVEGPKPFVAKSDAQARAAQSNLLESIQNRPLGQRQITVDNLISKDGLTLALGKASRYASVKDTMMRAAYRVVNHERAGDGVGSLHKSALRQADSYEKLVKAGAPESQKLAALRDLRTTLEGMQDKQVGRRILSGQNLAEASRGGIKDMLDFVDHEIASFPTEHLAKARDLMSSTYRELKQQGASLPAKLEMLTAARDHLLAAKEGGAFDSAAPSLLNAVEKEIATLTEHQPLKQELEAFVKDKATNLKHVETRQTDPVADMRARHQHLEHQEDVGKDFIRDMRQWRVGLDIQSFDKSTLNKVTTDERTGLDAMRDDLEYGALLDDLTGMLPGDHRVTQEAVIKDPDLSHLTARSLNSKEFNEFGGRLDKALRDQNPSAQEALSQELGLLLAEDLRRLPKDVQLGFATSHGDAFKNDLLHLLSSQLGTSENALSGNYSKATPEVRKMIDDIYSTAVTNLQDRFVSEDSVILDGVTYNKTRKLGEGGMGAVFIYEGTDQGQKVSIVIKVPLMAETPDEIRDSFDQMSSEARAHRAASEGNNSHVVGFRGTVRSPDGRLLLAMNLETGGDVMALGNKIQKAEKDGLISSHAANLIRISMLKDMAEGLRHLQEVRGMTHMDIKTLNYFIGEDGMAKLGDFGLAGTSLDRSYHTTPLDSAVNASPEIAQGTAQVAKTRTEISKAITQIKKRMDEELPKLPADEQQLAKADLQKTLDALQSLSSELEFSVNEKSDVFSLGTAAFELFRGSFFLAEITDSRWSFEQWSDLAKYGGSSDPQAALLGKNASGVSSGFGVTALDRVLNLMLQPDPDKRPSMTDLLSLSLFAEPGVGTGDVRDLIKLLNTSDATPESIREASAKLGV